MKKWYALVAVFVITFVLARWYSRHRPELGPLTPGNAVDVYLARGALVVDGDAADPLIEAKLFYAGEPRGPIELKDVLATATRVFFFFEVKSGIKYEAEIQTKHRQRKLTLEADPNVSPVEVSRIAIPAGEEPTGIGFSADGLSLYVSIGEKVRAYRVADGMEIPAEKANGPYKNKGTTSDDARFYAIIEPPKSRPPAHTDWAVLIFH